MSREYSVRVTRHLIDWALQQTSTQCGIALALKDADENFTHPVVTQERISITDQRDGQRYTFTTPAKLAKFIDQFDRDPSQCKPVSFTIDLDAADDVRPIKRFQPSEMVARHQRYQKEKAQGRVKSRAQGWTKRPLRGK